jgi:hypothetical protein
MYTRRDVVTAVADGLFQGSELEVERGSTGCDRLCRGIAHGSQASVSGKDGRIKGSTAHW